MPIQRTLLERLRDPEPPGQRQLRVSTREVFDSILHNLLRCPGDHLNDGLGSVPGGGYYPQ